MYLFLTTFFLLYGGMHLYAFLKARAAIAFGTGASICIGLFMLTMVFAPL
ncbi:MAG TPA: metallophosphoesterase, partial [Nitrospiraceae bacterium]|nr:metallophosphoesterase [Nitrospiraceae bacterium]